MMSSKQQLAIWIPSLAAMFVLAIAIAIGSHSSASPENEQTPITQPARAQPRTAPAPIPPAPAAPVPVASMPTVSTGRKLDAGPWLACREFMGAVPDVNNGVMSQDEFRSTMQSVYNHARLDPQSDVAVASQRLLSTLTIGLTNVSRSEADDTLRQQFLALVQACDGWETRR